MIYEIWNEGYAATGERAQAQYLGKYNGNTFTEAVKAALEDKKWNMSLFDENKLSYWGCRFFDNEKDARKIFG
jgi:hypothetical protein